MKLSVPKGETYIGGRGEVAVNANKFFDFKLNFSVSSYLCILIQQKDGFYTDENRFTKVISLFECQVKLQNYYLIYLMLYKSLYLRDGDIIDMKRSKEQY